MLTASSATRSRFGTIDSDRSAATVADNVDSTRPQASRRLDTDSDPEKGPEKESQEDQRAEKIHDCESGELTVLTGQFEPLHIATGLTAHTRAVRESNTSATHPRGEERRVEKRSCICFCSNMMLCLRAIRHLRRAESAFWELAEYDLSTNTGQTQVPDSLQPEQQKSYILLFDAHRLYNHASVRAAFYSILLAIHR